MVPCSDTRKLNTYSEPCEFYCLTGAEFDGHNFAKKALEMGAKKIYCEHSLGLPNEVVVPDTRLAFASAWAKYYGNPENHMKLIGITGTNGKTTTCFMVNDALRRAGKKTALIGTVHNDIDGEILPAVHTMPEPEELFKILRDAVSKGCEYAVLELSSQGLDQKRSDSIAFDVGAFLNLSPEHLDYHKTMENYFNAKCLMLQHCKKMVSNADDEYGKRLKADKYFRAGAAYLDSNVNAANAILDLLNIKTRASKNVSVPGRNEVLYNGEYKIICDFAHTAIALETILKETRKQTKGKLYVVFGCPGNRDRLKRPLMAKAASELADLAIMTTDNPQNEPVEQIFQDAMPGFLKGEIIEDRKEAIEKAVSLLHSGDTLILAGKGHEDYQYTKNGKEPFSEKEIISELCIYPSLKFQKPLV